jgi:hypothetical protein
LHGQASKTTYLINGDVCDRGENACEILLLIFALKLLHPHCIYFTRGNHETDWMNGDDHCGGFTREVKRKYSGRTFRLFSTIFELWPIAAAIGAAVGEHDGILVLHGGIPRHAHVSLGMLRDVDTRRQPPDNPSGIEDQASGP